MVRDWRTIAVGHSLAEAYDETLIALHVMPEDDFESYKESLILTPEFDKFSLDQGQDSAARVAREMVERELPEMAPDAVETHGRIDKPAEEILADADRINPRFVVIGGQRQSPVWQALFGSTTQQVVLNTEHPVVTVQQD